MTTQPMGRRRQEDRRNTLWIAAEDAVYRYLEAFDPNEKLSMEDYAASVLDSLAEASRKVERASR